MPTTDELLLDRIDIANAALDALRAELRTKMRRRDFLTGCAIIAATIGLVVGLFGIKATKDADRDTREGRVGACLQYNRQQDDAVTASATHDQVLAAILVPAPRSPLGEATVTRALEQLHQADLDGHKHRDCSPVGIRTYLSTRDHP